MLKILRTGIVWAKGNKTDCEYQEYYCEEVSIPGVEASYIQYTHPHFGQKFEVPKEWIYRIIWDK